MRSVKQITRESFPQPIYARIASMNDYCKPVLRDLQLESSRSILVDESWYYIE